MISALTSSEVDFSELISSFLTFFTFFCACCRCSSLNKRNSHIFKCSNSFNRVTRKQKISFEIADACEMLALFSSIFVTHEIFSKYVHYLHVCYVFFT